ncbi:unnamed protein product, partial [Tetraodon nigroviridis]
SHSRGARRKGRFKGSDGSTSSDTTTNSLVRQTWSQAVRMLLPDSGACETAVPFSPPRSPSCRAVGWAIAEEHSFHTQTKNKNVSWASAARTHRSWYSEQNQGICIIHYSRCGTVRRHKCPGLCGRTSMSKKLKFGLADALICPSSLRSEMIFIPLGILDKFSWSPLTKHILGRVSPNLT